MPAVTYPTSQFPTSGLPGAAPAPEKKRSAWTIVFAVLTVVFLLAAAGLAVLYVNKNNSLTSANKRSAATVAADNKKLADLQSQLQSANDALAAQKQTSDGQIADLQDQMKQYKACVDDFDKVNNSDFSSQASFDKAFTKLINICEAAAALGQ